jgi:hypothetical protein
MKDNLRLRELFQPESLNIRRSENSFDKVGKENKPYNFNSLHFIPKSYNFLDKQK